MREYLFRGKRKDNGRWVFGGILPDADSVEIVAVESFPGCFNPCSGYGEPPSSELCDYLVDPKTVGQYSGQKDHNGTYIFEGDIVKVYPTYIGLPDKVGVVEYDEDHSSYRVKSEYQTDWLGSLLSIRLEVVGNIYDNPEMLELLEEEES